jgi:hypothetical protein
VDLTYKNRRQVFYFSSSHLALGLRVKLAALRNNLGSRDRNSICIHGTAPPWGWDEQGNWKLGKAHPLATGASGPGEHPETAGSAIGSCRNMPRPSDSRCGLRGTDDTYTSMYLRTYAEPRAPNMTLARHGSGFWNKYGLTQLNSPHTRLARRRRCRRRRRRRGLQ